MPFLSAPVAYGVMLGAGGLLVAASLILFMVVLRDDGPKISGEREPTPLGWPIASQPEATSQDEKVGTAGPKQ